MPRAQAGFRFPRRSTGRPESTPPALGAKPTPPPIRSAAHRPGSRVIRALRIAAHPIAVAIPVAIVIAAGEPGAAFAEPASNAKAPAPPASALMPAPAEFWVIGPNEGESAGGHAAIRIDDWIYHVEHRGDGLIADRRTRRSRFEQSYRGRWNRHIEAIPLALDHAQVRTLESRLRKRAAERARALAELDATLQEAAWLQQVAAAGFLSIDVPGLGLFSDPSPGACANTVPTLRQALEARSGRARFEAQREAANRALHDALRDSLGAKNDARDAAAATERSSSPEVGSHRRLVHAAQAALAFEVIERCAPLAPERRANAAAMRTTSGNTRLEAPAVDPARWRAMRSELEDRIAELLESTRADRGLPLLLAAARWQALSESIESGELVWVRPFREARHRAPSRGHAEPAESENSRGHDDASPHDPRPASPLRSTLPEGWAEAVHVQAVHDLRVAWAHFGEGRAPLEARLSALERAGHTYEHVRAGTHHESPTSPLFGPSLALRYAAQSRVLAWPEGGSIRWAAERRDALWARAERQRARLMPSLGYALLTQNCVTELLDELERTFREELRSDWQRVGRGEFIPAVAGRYLESAIGAGPRRTLPSAHERIRHQLQRTGASTAWRERTPLTSHAYAPHEADSAFLFFTAEAPVWTRPLIGSANLGFAALSSAVGVLQAPFDRGQRLQRSLRGMVMSVPELVFASVRQGTYPIDPPAAVFELGTEESGQDGMTLP